MVKVPQYNGNKKKKVTVSIYEKVSWRGEEVMIELNPQN